MNNRTNYNLQREDISNKIFEFGNLLQKIELSKLSEDSTDVILLTLLEYAATFYQADRGYILEIDWELECGMITHEWRTDSNIASKQKTILQIELLSKWKKSFFDRIPFDQKTDELKLCQPMEYEFLQGQGIYRILAVPLYPKVTGFLVVENPKRYAHYAEFLKIISYAAVLEIIDGTVSQKASNHQHHKISIHFLGGLQIVSSIGALDEKQINSPTCCKLLAYLCLNKGKSISAQRIAEHLWYDQLIDDPGKAVRNALYRIRKILSQICPEPLIISAGNGYQLNHFYDVKTDIEQFETLCSVASKENRFEISIDYYRSAIALYRDDMLPNYNFLHWLMPQISYYHLLFLDTIKKCLKQMLSANMYLDVCRLACHAISFEDTDADLYYYLIKSLVSQGAFQQAKKHCLAVRSLLTQEEFEQLLKLLPQST